VSNPEKVQEGYPGSLSEFDYREKQGALRHKIPKPETPKPRGGLHRRSRKISRPLYQAEEQMVILGVRLSGEVGCVDT
jgi:hypothetical protein